MEDVELKVNGRLRALSAELTTPLLYLLRNDLGLNSPRFGCGQAQCGACTVLVDDRALRSCVTPLSAVIGSEVTTVEGLASGGEPHPLQLEFIAGQAAQCGFCASGMLMAAAALLRRNSAPSEAEVASALRGNLCRCGAHNRIVRAVVRAAGSSPAQ